MSSDPRPLLVFFCSQRSGPARRMESVVAHLARKERHRLRVHQVDLERRPDLAAKLHVDSAPAIVLVKERRVVARLVGRASAPQIEALVDPHLESLAAPV